MVDVDAMGKPPSKRAKETLTAPLQGCRVRGMWSRGQRDGRWYLRVYRHEAGREVPVWSGRATRLELEEHVRRALALEVAEVLPLAFVPETVGELLDWYTQEHQRNPQTSPRTKTIVRGHAAHLKSHLGAVGLGQLRTSHLRRYRDHMEGPALGYAQSTVRVQLQTLVTACRAARAEGWLTRVPAMPPKAKRQRRVVPDYTPSRAELHAVLEKLTGWRRLAFAFQAYTGMRLSEVAVLRWKHIQRDRLPQLPKGVVGLVHIPNVPGAKTGARTVPLRAELAAELDAYQGSDRGPKTQPEPREHAKVWVRLHHKGLDFATIAAQTGATPDHVRLAVRRWAHIWPHTGDRNPNGRVLGVSVRSAHDLGPAIAKVCAELGLPRFTSHALRRSMADTLQRSGVDPSTAAAILGMSAEVMMRHYRKATQDDVVHGASRLDLGVEDTAAKAAGDNVVPFRHRED